MRLVVPVSDRSGAGDSLDDLRARSHAVLQQTVRLDACSELPSRHLPRWSSRDVRLDVLGHLGEHWTIFSRLECVRGRIWFVSHLLDNLSLHLLDHVPSQHI